MSTKLTEALAVLIGYICNGYISAHEQVLAATGRVYDLWPTPNQPGRSQHRSGVLRLRAILRRRTIVTDVVQGMIVGPVLAFIPPNLPINTQIEAMRAFDLPQSPENVNTVL